MKVSVIVPLKNREAEIQPLYLKLKETLGSHFITYEIIFIDNGSTDGTFQVVKGLGERDRRLKSLSLLKDGGYDCAIMSGIQFAMGDVYAVLDINRGDPPELLPEMVSLLAEKRGGAVLGVYNTPSKRSLKLLFKKITAKIFNKILGEQIPFPISSLTVFDAQVALFLKGLKERNKYLQGLILWSGFSYQLFHHNRESCPKPPKRSRWHSSFGSRELFLLSGFSKNPLKIAFKLGLLSFAAAFLLLIWVLVLYFSRPYMAPGWVSLIIVTLLFSGCQLLIIGFLSEYIGSLFDEAKQRPEYLIRDSVNINTGESKLLNYIMKHEP